MKISIFTPSHNPKYLDEAEKSVVGQLHQDWEWIVLMNSGAVWKPKSGDKRIRVINANEVKGVGHAKRLACSFARGDVLLELDHDDILSMDALYMVDMAFSYGDAVFVYSDFAQINEDGTSNYDRFDPAYGWDYCDDAVNDQIVNRCLSMPLYPATVSYIWFAPNHLRAFTREAYEAVGGYNEELDVLDDLNLMARLYQYGEFTYINECLYLQRVHPENTQSKPELNARIQVETIRMYDEQVEKNALAWAKRNNLLCLDLGSAHNKPEGYRGLDMHEAPGVDIVANVLQGIPVADNSVGVIRAHDFLEHIPDKVGIFNEMYRVLAHGGMLLSMTPSTDGRGAFQDPTHVAFYNENSFWYHTSQQYAKYVPEINCKFQISRIATMFPTDWHKQHDISYVMANLVAIKDGPRIAGVEF